MNAPPILRRVPTRDISVVVPVIRFRSGLERCLRSVVESSSYSLFQSLKGVTIQHIVRNACEDPEARAKVEALASKYGFTSIESPFVPMTDSWNNCIDLAHGRYIHLLADDDYVQRGFYAAIAAKMEGKPLAISTGYEVEQDGDITFENRVRNDEHNMLERLEKANPLVPSAVVVSREAYEAVGGYRPRGVLDWDLYLRIALYAKKTWNRPNPAWRLIPEYLVRRVEHPESATTEDGPAQFFQHILNIIQDHEARASQKPEYRIQARDLYGEAALRRAVELNSVELFKLARSILVKS